MAFPSFTKTICRASIWPLPVRKINGIGPKADAKLNKLPPAHHW
jgi:hypothetical protein